MWEIVICDADESFVEEVKKRVSAFYGERGMEIRITKYLDAYAFIEDVDKPMDLILMGTKQNKVDGYVLSDVIRSRPAKKNTILVFLGEKDEDVFGAFVYRPFDYIRKHRWEIDLPVMLQRLWKADHRQRSVEIRYQRKTRRVRVSDIMYIEGQGHDLTVYCTRGENYRFRAKMAEYEKQLQGYYFVHSAKSFLVNCAYVKEVSDRVTLNDGSEIPCSKSCMAQIKQMWQRYMKEIMRVQ